jgi:hypothetical protein
VRAAEDAAAALRRHRRQADDRQYKVTVFNLPNTRHRHCFCSTCGSALPDMQMNGTLLKVPAGSLDSDVRIRPDAHIFLASKANWDDALEQIPKVSRLP